MFKRVMSPGEGITGLHVGLFEKGWTLRKATDKDCILEVKVPGNVRAALVDAGIIADPFIGKNNETSKWVSDVSWVYSNTFSVPSLDALTGGDFPEGGMFHLVFDAIDYDATFCINGERVCRQTGMFSPVDVATGIVRGGKIRDEPFKIDVRFHVQPWWRQHAVKCQMAFGWDFAPEMRTVGIWKHVRAFLTGPAFFSDVFVNAVPLNATNPLNVKVSAKCVISLMDPGTMEPLGGAQSLDVQITAGGITKDVRVTAFHEQPLDIDLGTIELKPWYPWSAGEQARTPVSIKVFWKGAVSDEFRGYVVNRQVTWVKNPGTLPRNENWTFIINDEKMFLRGINWVPPDALYGRIDEERYHRLVDAALDMNIDMFRVWGGGIEEKTEFYDYCDEVGMMIWQEFPFACTNYPRAPAYVNIVKHEIEGMVKRTRRHPSVVVYCGGNEFNPFINSHIVSLVKGAVASHAPGIHCFKASPFSGDDHNWRVYNAVPLLRAYDINFQGPFKMLTEFGVRGAPDASTLQICYGNKASMPDITSIHDELQYHKADVANLVDFAGKFGQKITDIPSMIHVSQLIQGYALKYAIEGCRAGWPNVSGVFPWQLSDPWPNVSWSIIDHDLKPKLATRCVRMAYTPVLPLVRSWRRARGTKNAREGDVIIQNATQQDFIGNLRVEIIKKQQKGGETPLDSKKMGVKVSPSRALKATTIQVEDVQGIVVRMYLLDGDGNQVSYNFQFPAMEPNASVRARIVDTLNARFDGWWRKYMITLMEMQKLREDMHSWQRMKEERRIRLQAGGR